MGDYHLCPVILSVHSSHHHLCLCLAGSSCTLGFPHVEKQQSYEHRFLFVFGDCVCLWIFALHLYPHSCKYHTHSEWHPGLVENSTGVFISSLTLMGTWKIPFEFRSSVGMGIGSQVPLLDLKSLVPKAFTSVCMLGCFSRLYWETGVAEGTQLIGSGDFIKHRYLEWTNASLSNTSKKVLLSLLFFQVLWVIPQKAVRWILVMIALGISGSVLAMTFWPAVREDNRRIALATIVTIVLLHTLLSVGCLVWSHSCDLPMCFSYKCWKTSSCYSQWFF